MSDRGSSGSSSPGPTYPDSSSKAPNTGLPFQAASGGRNQSKVIGTADLFDGLPLVATTSRSSPSPQHLRYPLGYSIICRRKQYLEGWQRFTQNTAIFFLERTLNAFQLLISGDSTADGIIHVQGGQKPGLWSRGKTRRLWASVRRFRPWAESKFIGQVPAIIRRGWKESQVARFAAFSRAKWPIFTRIVAIGHVQSGH